MDEYNSPGEKLTVHYRKIGFLPLVILALLSIVAIYLGNILSSLKLIVLGYFLLLATFMSIFMIFSMFIPIYIKEGIKGQIEEQKYDRSNVEEDNK